LLQKSAGISEAFFQPLREKHGRENYIEKPSFEKLEVVMF